MGLEMGQGAFWWPVFLFHDWPNLGGPLKVLGQGFEGVGRATGGAARHAVHLRWWSIRETAERSGFHVEFADDLERCEYVVPVEWTGNTARRLLRKPAPGILPRPDREIRVPGSCYNRRLRCTPLTLSRA